MGSLITMLEFLYNICFEKDGDDYIVKLIDFDRCQSNHKPVDIGHYSGKMYKGRTERTAAMYDWRSLAYLTSYLIQTMKM